MPEVTNQSQTSWRQRIAGYFAAHWGGEHSLARAFWINTILLASAASMMAALVIIAGLLAWAMIDDRVLLLPDGPFSWALAPFTAATIIWGTVGVFRSAKRAAHQGTRWTPGFAILIVGLLVVCTSIDYVRNFSKSLAELRYFLKIMGGHSALTISPDSETLLIEGDISPGFADVVNRVLQDGSDIRFVDLASPGGLGHEAKLVAQTVRRRGLNTRAVSECNSACTTIFLAGRERILGNDGTLGFHRPLPIGGPDDASTLAKAYEAELRQAGLPAEFARRAANTPHDSIWRPSVDELFKAGVITHIETTPSRLIDTVSPPSQP